MVPRDLGKSSLPARLPEPHSIIWPLRSWLRSRPGPMQPMQCIAGNHAGMRVCLVLGPSIGGGAFLIEKLIIPAHLQPC